MKIEINRVFDNRVVVSFKGADHTSSITLSDEDAVELADRLIKPIADAKEIQFQERQTNV